MGERTGIAWTDHTFNPWWGFSDASGYMRDYRVWISDGGVFDSIVERLIEDALARALAFRAAARQP